MSMNARSIKKQPITPTNQCISLSSEERPINVLGNAPTKQLAETNPSAVPTNQSGIQAKMINAHIMLIYATKSYSMPISLTP